MAKTTIKHWDKEAVTALIKVYKHKPCLYDLKSVDYYNRESARDALADMVTVVSQYYPHVTEEDCRKKYQSLRNQFCKEHVKVLASKLRTDTDPYIPKLWCYDHLVFLKGSLYKKKGSFTGCAEENQDEYDCFTSDDEEMSMKCFEESEEDLDTFVAETTVSSAKKRKIEPVSPKKLECLPNFPSPVLDSRETLSPSSSFERYLNNTARRTSSRNKYVAFGDFVGIWLADIKNKKSQKKAMCDMLNVIAKYELEDSD